MSKRNGKKGQCTYNEHEAPFSIKEKPFDGHRYGHRVMLHKNPHLTLEDITANKANNRQTNSRKMPYKENDCTNLKTSVTNKKNVERALPPPESYDDCEDEEYDHGLHDTRLPVEDDSYDGEDSEDEDVPGKHETEVTTDHCRLNLVECNKVSANVSSISSAASRYETHCEMVGIKDSASIFQENVKRTTRKYGWKYYKMVDETDYLYTSEFATYMLKVLGIDDDCLVTMKKKEQVWAGFKRHVMEGMQAARSSATQALKKQFLGK
jgi:hypothetical protein